MTADTKLTPAFELASPFKLNFCGESGRGQSFYERHRSLSIYADEAIKNYGIHLIGQLHTTAGCRYEAARRHKKKNRLSILAILILTFYAMFFSMISTFDKIVPAPHKDSLALLSVFMSSFIAAFSVYEATKRYDVRSENFLRSARLISDLRDRLNIDYLKGQSTWDSYNEYQEEYAGILDSYSDNHANVDFLVFRSNVGKLNRCKRWRAKVSSFLTIWWLIIFAATSPILVFVLYFAVAQYAGTIMPKPVLPPPPTQAAPAHT